MVGIDLLPKAKLESAFELFISADLDKGLDDAKPALKGRSFDKILLQDVLEHLRVPERLLQDCRDLLKPHGQMLISVPNIANITVRISLLLGRFEYTQRGILDKTHVRFFTRRTARRLLEENGYEIVDEKTTVMPIELALGVSADNPVMRKLNRALGMITKLMPSIFGYQIIFVARNKRPTQGEG